MNARPHANWGTKNDDVLFCTAGIQHLCFWRKKGRGIVSKKATFGLSSKKSKSRSKGKSKIIILSMDWLKDGTLACGTSNGQILMWEKEKNLVYLYVKLSILSIGGARLIFINTLVSALSYQ